MCNGCFCPSSIFSSRPLRNSPCGQFMFSLVIVCVVNLLLVLKVFSVCYY